MSITIRMIIHRHDDVLFLRKSLNVVSVTGATRDKRYRSFKLLRCFGVQVKGNNHLSDSGPVAQGVPFCLNNRLSFATASLPSIV